MQELKIACGSSRQAKHWSNKTITTEELFEKLKKPVRTSETMEEYANLSKKQRDDIKDIGGYVPGYLLEGRRTKKNIECRSMLAYDFDAAEKEYTENIGEQIPNKGCCHSTHSSTPVNPRIRVLIPLTRDLTPDEFNAVARLYASDHGFINMVDPCSFEPQQLMYWPSCPSDGDYIFRTLDGDWLDPDTVLAAHPDWRDCSALPSTMKETHKENRLGKRQQDPLEKEGIVGAVCRAYTIQNIIDRYLPDVYAPAEDGSGRYDYIPGEGSNGVLIYNDKFAYSHHATDPASGRLCNAFDLVRIHKFGDADEKASFKAADAFFRRDDRVNGQIYLDNQNALQEDFPPEDEGSEAAKSENDSGPVSSDWFNDLRYNRDGKLMNTHLNLTTILENDPELKNIVFNELADNVEITGPVPWRHPTRFWRDVDDLQLMHFVARKYLSQGANFPKSAFQISFPKVVDDRSYHPIRDYLSGLPEWDGVNRVDTLLVVYFGAENSPYTRAVTRKLLCAAVARVMRPGIKFDYILVLNGPQGIGKSTFISNLGGEWYSDSLALSDMNDKTAAEKLQGYWIIEIGELAGIRKADMDRVKAFISRQDDKYRAAFGHRVTPHPRQSVFFGTTNAENGYLRDITGNRRFWTVRVPGTGIRKPWDMTESVVQQIWAEAVILFKDGEKLYLPPELEQAAQKVQSETMEEDDREGLVRRYLDIPLPKNWGKMQIYEKRNYIDDPADPTRLKGTVRRDSVCNLEIWCECFGGKKEEIKSNDSYTIAKIMKRIDGWENLGDRRTIPGYGRQRVYVRTQVPGQPQSDSEQEEQICLETVSDEDDWSELLS